MVPGVEGSAGPEVLVQDCPPAAAACKMAPFSKQEQHCFILFFGLYPPFQTWTDFYINFREVSSRNDFPMTHISLNTHQKFTNKMQKSGHNWARQLRRGYYSKFKARMLNGVEMGLAFSPIFGLGAGRLAYSSIPGQRACTPFGVQKRDCVTRIWKLCNMWH